MPAPENQKVSFSLREPITAEMWVAMAAAVAAGMRYQFGPGVTPGLIAAVLLAPVWWRVLGSYRFGKIVVFLGMFAAANGLLLAVFETSRPVSSSMTTSSSLLILAFTGSIGLLLWSRTVLGIGMTAICYGAGMLGSLALSGLNTVNPWKFSLALPLAIALLGFAALAQRRVFEGLVLATLAAISLVSDSRSMTGFLLFAAVLVAWQILPRTRGRRPRTWQTLLMLAAFGFAGFNLFQGLLLDGALGAAAQARTAAQIEVSGSVLLGGRPELGASFALLIAQPWGYGSGVAPLSSDIWTAKTGMSVLGYDPNNGYVEKYMFGGHFEVHSVLGDLWIIFGPVGAAFILLLLIAAAYGTVRSFSQQAAPGLLLFLLLLGAWDVFFSPLLASYRNLVLMFVAAAIPIAQDLRRPHRAVTLSGQRR